MAKRIRSSAPRRGLFGWIGILFTTAFYTAWTALIVVAPLFAAWVASSLAAHVGGSIRVAAASGLLVFPVLPVVWEAVAAWRRARQPSPKRRFLTLTDRLVLRTLAVSLAFLGALLVGGPRRVFAALNSRGDWALDGRHDPRAEAARRRIFWLAAKSEWLYKLTDDNPFHADGRVHPRPQPLPTRVEALEIPTPDPGATPEPDDETTALPEAPRGAHAWPWAGDLHPAVRALPPAVETSPEAVGRYLAAQERDPWNLARAVHDYVADRVAYDVESYRAGAYPPQDAATTFRTRKSVCAGYANLFEAVGRAAGLNVTTVVGRARHPDDADMGEGHAWSAVKLDGRWHLIDTTWDAGYVNADGFHKRYATWYFLTPPEVFVTMHFPDQGKWQLLPVARTPGEYMRAPALDPEFFANGLRMISPERAESDAHGSVEVVIDNPRRFSLLVDVHPVGGERRRCEVEGGARITAHCPLDVVGLHEVSIYASPRRYGTHRGVGALRIHNR